MGVSNFTLVPVDGKITLELVNSQIYLTKEECIENKEEFLKNIDNDEAELVYKKLEDEIDYKFKSSIGPSRRVIVSKVPDVNSSDYCTSLIHLLLNREENCIIVHQRSLSNKFFLSDIGFFVSLAIKYNANLQINIGSFHFLV